MKKRNFFISVLFIAIMTPAFLYPFYTSVSFENKSEKYIDSVVFYINNFKLKIININPGETKQEAVNMDSVKLNNHDAIVRAYIYIKDSLFRDTYNYNDLRGDLNEKYTLILNKDLTTRLVSK